MNYIKETIEFTSEKECFSGHFLKNGTMHHDCNVGILNGLINYTTVIDAYICKRYFNSERDKSRLTINLREPVWGMIQHAIRTSGVTMDDVTVSPNGAQEVKVEFESLDSWIKVRQEKIETHTKLAVADEELILTKVKNAKNSYAIFWFSRTRNNSIMYFKTRDTINVIEAAFLEYVNSCEFEKVYNIPANTYKGWLKCE